ncbi:Protein of unknown function (DUF630 and DUF632) [Quillaja saponaria]|uniref:Uncharacterized protein n=1 Tax=Quillaja saponaria TaxID=32244 RepID=A0AAD7L598_QUISA|nr:Protein of unknown function (DUF630 and DUF632) [Quillaja saponaria]
MGCAESKIDLGKAVLHCEDRKNYMEEAVSARNAFSSASSGFAMFLKNTGACLSDYAHGLDDIKITNPDPKPGGPNVGEKVDNEYENGGSLNNSLIRRNNGIKEMEDEVVRELAPGPYNVSLLQVFSELDDHFLKASESSNEVSKMLVTTRLHYGINFADNRGHMDHTARVMRAITWNRSFRVLDMPIINEGKDDFYSDEQETHATILDKLLAWEKQLYDEVKAGELMKINYQRQVAMLNKLKQRISNSKTLEKAKEEVSYLRVRYVVDMQSMELTVSEINRLRDKQLYPKLVQLADGMATMWETMQIHHGNQLKILDALRSLDISQSPKETSEHHHERTWQLWSVVQEWNSQFEKLIKNQKDYVKALSNWLKLNLIPIESILKEKVSSPPRIQNPPILVLLHAWQNYLEKLPDELARTAISNFAEIIKTIISHQDEEMLLKQKCDDTRKELIHKTRQFEDRNNKYMLRRILDEVDQDSAEDISAQKNSVAEKQVLLETVKKRLKEEEEACSALRMKSLAILKNGMPELFRVMTDFSRAYSKMLMELSSTSHRQNPSENLS